LIVNQAINLIFKQLETPPKLKKNELKPPWQQNIFSSIIAAIGKQLKQSVNVFHNLILNLLLPVYNNQMIRRLIK
jgi:hypothetical protein